jgi:hypothetical protein
VKEMFLKGGCKDASYGILQLAKFQALAIEARPFAKRAQAAQSVERREIKGERASWDFNKA